MWYCISQCTTAGTVYNDSISTLPLMMLALGAFIAIVMFPNLSIKTIVRFQIFKSFQKMFIRIFYKTVLIAICSKPNLIVSF